MWACERISRASERGGYFERIVKLSEQSSSARRAGHGLSACLARNWVQHNWARVISGAPIETVVALGGISNKDPELRLRVRACHVRVDVVDFLDGVLGSVDHYLIARPDKVVPQLIEVD
jgi:hypothetical protein